MTFILELVQTFALLVIAVRLGETIAVLRGISAGQFTLSEAHRVFSK